MKTLCTKRGGNENKKTKKDEEIDTSDKAESSENKNIVEFTISSFRIFLLVYVKNT